jgi:hypothetical protein
MIILTASKRAAPTATGSNMFNEYVEHDSEDFFSDRTSMIAGIATLRLEFEEDYSADIGGTDGHVCVATLIEVKVGNATFTADQIAQMFGAKVVVEFEKCVAEYEGTK